MSTEVKKKKSAARRAAMQGLLIIVVCVFTLEATSILQYYFSSKTLTKEANGRASGQLDATEGAITAVADQVETAVRNTVWSVEHQLNKPDSLATITARMLSQNDIIYGSTVALVGKNVAPYSYRSGDSIISSTLATDEYDYHNQEWFTKPIEIDGGYWSEPYYDEGGGNILMTTYSVPVKVKGQVKAVFTADVSLDWLTNLVNGVKVYPNAFNMVLSRSGQVMVCPAETLVMRRTIRELESSSEEAQAFKEVDDAMLSGQSGSSRISVKGHSVHVFYDQIPRTGWSMSIIVPDEEIYGSLRDLGIMVKVLQILGVIMILIIISYTVQNQRKLRRASENKTRMEGELQAASDIQRSMLPKTFPPFPERDDVDMSAALVSAKEVGGDLYDFYIRDEKLFFCIGDVSGKGVPASLFMAVTRSLFRSVSIREDSPKRIVATINESLSDSNEASMFVTFFCGVLDMKSGHLRYCNAGHNDPVLLTDHKEMLDVLPNVPLGVMGDFNFVEQEIDLKYDDAIFMYTDGITEAENIDKELFGEERMLQALSTRRTADQLMEAMKEAVLEFRGEAPQSDDITCLFIHYLGHPQDTDPVRYISFDNDINQIPRLEDYIEAIAATKSIDGGTAMALNLALEEAVSNVMMYAYPQEERGSINLKAILHADSIEFVLSDNGVPFDPTASPDVDTSLGVDERAIGGLGIHLVRNIMDEVRYARRDGMNILTMIKNLK